MYLFVFLCITVVSAHAQTGGYLANRIKPGDILYRDGNGQEHFVDYRQWDQADPPGTALGVVFYSYYGTVPCGVEDGEQGWHGWVVETGERDECQWAPIGSVCYDTCVARYPVEGIETPFNPFHEVTSLGIGDTCGWQNTKRLVEFIYTGCGAEISTATSPALHYIYTEKNGITDLSQKPVVQGDFWYLPSYGQIRMMYGFMGFVNAAMAACGGTMFSQGSWHSSTEVSTCSSANWSCIYDGSQCTTSGWFKKSSRIVRAVRSF